MGDDTQKDAAYISAKPVTGRRLWLFRFLAVTLIPALLFVLVEVSLRIVGYGYPTTATIKTKLYGMDAYCNNLQFCRRFFPRNLGGEANPFIFPANKPENTYRIFVMGGSAAHGTPAPSIGFARIFEKMLQQQYPSVKFEVINTAIVATNSHVVLEIAKDCAAHQPDLFMVYMGNNELVGPFGAGNIGNGFACNLSVIRASMAFKSTRFGQLLMNLGESAGAQQSTPSTPGGLELFIEHQVRADNPGLETIYRNFQTNLEDIGRIALKSGAKIIFSTVGVNLKDSPPFSSMHRIGLTDAELKKWDGIYRQGVSYETSGEYDKAVQQYLLAAEIDDSFADLQFRLGRCYWSVEEFVKARDRYIKARQLDTLRFRADSRINEVIANAASGRGADGVYLADAVKAFEKISPHNTPGEELFYEHVHLNFRGNYALAKEFFMQVKEILPERIKSKKAKEVPLLTIKQCAEDLAFTTFDRYRVCSMVLDSSLKHPPFTNQLYHNQRIEKMQRKIEQLESNAKAPQRIMARYWRAIQKSPSDRWLRWKYGSLLEEMGNDLAAIEQYKELVAFMPNCYLSHTRLTFLLTKYGDIETAIHHGLQAIDIKPTNALSLSYLAKAYQYQGTLDKAEEYYHKAIRYKAVHVPSYLGLGTVLHEQGKFDEVVETLREGLSYAPDSVDIRHKLGLTLMEQGHLQQAAEEFRAALKLHPESKILHTALSSCEELLRL